MLDYNTKYQLVKNPYTPLRILEILELENDEVYIRYKQENKEADWKIIKQDKIGKTFEDYADKDLLEMIDIEEDYPEQGRDILGLDSDGFKHYCFKSTCTYCSNWKCSVSGMTLIADIIKWKYIN